METRNQKTKPPCPQHYYDPFLLQAECALCNQQMARVSGFRNDHCLWITDKNTLRRLCSRSIFTIASNNRCNNSSDLLIQKLAYNSKDRNRTNAQTHAWEQTNCSFFFFLFLTDSDIHWYENRISSLPVCVCVCLVWCYLRLLLFKFPVVFLSPRQDYCNLTLPIIFSSHAPQMHQ